MKKKILLSAAITLCCIPSLVFASSNENDVYIKTMTGVELTKKQYDNLSKGFEHNTIITMAPELIEKLKDDENIKEVNTNKYYRSSVIEIDGEQIYYEEEITQEEYENAEAEEEQIYMPYAVAKRSDSYRNSTLRVAIAGNVSDRIITYTNRWVKMPAMKSYDVSAIAFLSKGFSVDIYGGTKRAYQNYDGNIINYDPNGDKWVIQKNDIIYKTGIGISMNLVDSAKNYIETSMTISLDNGEWPFTVRAAYGHSIVDTPLADSKKYSIDPSGIGGVLLFNSSIRNHYDQSLAGLEVTMNENNCFD